MLKLLPFLFLLTLPACSSDESDEPTVEADSGDIATETAPNPMVEAPTPSMEELLAGIPEEPVPDAPENLTRAQRDGQRVEIISEPRPAEVSPAPEVEPKSEPASSATAAAGAAAQSENELTED